MLLEKKITKLFDCIVVVGQCSVEGMTFSFHPVKCTMIDRCVINSAFFVCVREQQWTQGAICAAQTVKWPILCKVLSTGPASQSRQVINQNASKVESLLMSGQKNQLS